MSISFYKIKECQYHKESKRLSSDKYLYMIVKKIRKMDYYITIRKAHKKGTKEDNNIEL